MDRDIFEEFLENNKNSVALTDNSYKKIFEQENHKIYDGEVNTRLATYGDAVLKLALCQILLDSEENAISAKKQEYESDEVLVNVIAKHYDILKCLRYDTNDDQKPKDYNYIKNKNGDSPHKYIATAVEACIGEIYRQKKQKIKPIITIAKKWIDLINNTPYNT